MSGLHLIPLSWLVPLRLGAVRFRRGSLERNICIGLLKILSKGRSIGSERGEFSPLDEQIVFEASDSMVIDAIYWFGMQGYEGILTKIWKSLCHDAANVLEIGGNVGVYTAIGAKSMQRGLYTVVEPHPDVVAILRRNIARNFVVSSSVKIEIVEGAATSEATRCPVKINIPDEKRDAPVGAHLVDHTEISQRSSARIMQVAGIPFAELASRRDLIKIDAEGIEHDLLDGARDLLMINRPTIVVEVLPEAEKLGAFIGVLARECGYTINVVPSYGSEIIVTVPPQEFTSRTPMRYNSKDIVLSKGKLLA